MSWVKIDDQFPDHPKVARMGDLAPLAGWLYVAANCYASRQLTDGFIPRGTVPRLATYPSRVKPLALAALLVEVGLWEEVDGGFQIHDYLVYNPSRADVESRRRAWAERQRKSRSDSPVTSDGVTRESVSPVPLSRSRSASGEAHIARDGLPNLDSRAIAVLEEHTGEPWSRAGDKQMGEFDRLVGAHGLDAVSVAFGAIRQGKPMTARQLVWGAVKHLEPIPDAKHADKAANEQRDQDAARRRVEATLRQTHGYGAHDTNPNPRCPDCQRGTAA